MESICSDLSHQVTSFSSRLEALHREVSAEIRDESGKRKKLQSGERRQMSSRRRSIRSHGARSSSSSVAATFAPGASAAAALDTSKNHAVSRWSRGDRSFATQPVFLRIFLVFPFCFHFGAGSAVRLVCFVVYRNISEVRSVCFVDSFHIFAFSVGVV